MYELVEHLILGSCNEIWNERDAFRAREGSVNSIITDVHKNNVSVGYLKEEYQSVSSGSNSSIRMQMPRNHIRLW